MWPSGKQKALAGYHMTPPARQQVLSARGATSDAEIPALDFSQRIFRVCVASGPLPRTGRCFYENGPALGRART